MLNLGRSGRASGDAVPVDKLWVGRELKPFCSARLKAMHTSETLEEARADIKDLRRHDGGPMGCLYRRVGPDKRHDTPNTGLQFIAPAHDPIGANTVGTQQDDLSQRDMLVRGVAIPREHLQAVAIGELMSDENFSSQPPDPHVPRLLGIPLWDSNVKRDPLGTEL